MGDASVRVGFWNTWLLRPRLWRGGPAIPGGDRFFAPDVTRRAPMVGAAVRDRFDVVALSEVFEESEQDAVAVAWPAAVAVPGPQRQGLKRTGSGLLTLVDPRAVTVEARASHPFRTGGDLRDSDTFASKGVVFTRLRIGADGPSLDLFATHLIAGGDLFPVPGANDQARHHAARMRQVDELVGFVEAQRDPASPVLVVGDLNVMAHDPALGEPDQRYRDLAARLTRIGLVDVWADHGVGPGSTCTFTDAADLPVDPDETDRVLDRADDEPGTAAGERIDYLWLGQAADGATVTTADRPRRWAFPGRSARGGPAGSLSDHLALSTVLHVR